ncbi:MAG: replicative DNA helicase [Caldicoprobacterales bacterium]|jgi:replicative DNA helicase|nr:replicative DNA helicase [Clostridiales bacterium]
MDSAAQIQRIPPYSLDAEQSVLGSMLLDKEAVAAASEVLSGEDFYSDAHKEIYEAILDIYDHGTPVDLVTLAEALRQRGSLEAVGGGTYISDLSMAVPSTANVRYYIRIVEEKSILRRLITASNDIIKESYEAAEDLDIIIDHAEKKIFEIAQKKNSRSFESIKTILLDTYAKIEELTKNKGKIVGVPTGFHDFDLRTSGLNKSDLILIAARPSMGKTSFAINIAQNAAVRHQIPVAIFSLEMAKDQLAQRMLSSESNIELQKIRTGDLSEQDWIKLVHAATPLSQAPIFIDDTPAVTAMEIRSKARRLKLEHNLGLIVIDYLQLMSGRGKAESRQQEVSEISRSLKALARELQVPVVALSQLSRGPESRQDHRPMLSDLRESGAIEQDADVVVFLYRDEYYNPDSEKKNIAEAIIAKQRNGPTGTVELVWLGQFTKFASLERNREIY